jgi:hypothetical protein
MDQSPQPSSSYELKLWQQVLRKMNQNRKQAQTLQHQTNFLLPLALDLDLQMKQCHDKDSLGSHPPDQHFPLNYQ